VDENLRQQTISEISQSEAFLLLGFLIKQIYKLLQVFCLPNSNFNSKIFCNLDSSL
jgi:hypothetical protein